MKINHIISSITSLVCALGINCLGINSAGAANLNFTYTLESDESISGSFEGDLVPGTTEYENLSNLNATYSAAPGIIFDTIDAGSSFNTNFSEFFSIVARSSSAPENFFAIIGGDNTDVQVSVPSAGVNDSDSTLVSSIFEVDVDNGVTTTPEPGITLALIALGSLGCLHKLRKREVAV